MRRKCSASPSGSAGVMVSSMAAVSPRKRRRVHRSGRSGMNERRPATAGAASAANIEACSNHPQETIMKEALNLVLGGTGKTGRRVAQGLEARGLGVRIGSRAAVPGFDWDDARTWPAALEGVDAVYIAYHPDLAVPGAPAAIQAFTDLAVRSGVAHLVLLSGRGEPEAQRCEDIVRRAGVDWTVIRASWFCQNFSEGYLLDPI